MSESLNNLFINSTNTHTMENDWDLSSIVHSCKATTITNPSTICETPPQNLTTTNNIISSINTTPYCYDDFIFNQENSSVANTHTMENDWDLSSIVRRCKVTTFTNPSTFCETLPQNLTNTLTTTATNSPVSPINTTPSCFADFTFNQESSYVSISPLKPNDFIDLNKLRINFNSTTHIPTPETTMHTSAITTPTTSNHTTIIPIATTTTFTNPTTTINTHTTAPTHPQQLKLQSGIRKSKNLVTSVCHVKEDKLLEDQWQWKKYGQKFIKGSSKSRSYYKCSSFKNCPARKQFEKSETEENTYVVTYRGKHDHQKSEETSQNKSSEARLPVVGQVGSSQNFENLGYPNVVMVQFDQSESNNAQVLDGHSKITNPEIELNESQSHVVGEAELSQNVQKFDSHNRMMVQHDESEKINAQIFLGEVEIPYSETSFVASSNDDEDILIPNMSAMLEDFLLDINHHNGRC